MDIQIGNWHQLNWLWLVMMVLLVTVSTTVIRRHAMGKFATPRMLRQLIPPNSSRRFWIKSSLSLLAMLLLVVALVDVRWGKTWHEVSQKGMEVVFALDVSRSMLADDVAPNRLDRAKQQISDMVDEMAGDRVGLVVFAGESRKQVPLTRHYHDFRTALKEVGPWDVDRGGSDLGAALLTAADTFLEKTGDHKAIVVFSDGEDQQSDPVDVARQLYADKGIRVFTVGIGDAETGARVPAPRNSAGSPYLQYNGQTVWSKLNSTTLKQMADAAGGAWIPAETRLVDMGDVYHRFIEGTAERDFETARINTYVPRFQIFVFLALALYLASVFWPAKKPVQLASEITEDAGRRSKSIDPRIQHNQLSSIPGQPGSTPPGVAA